MIAQRRFHVRAARAAGATYELGQKAQVVFVMAVVDLAVLMDVMIIEPLAKIAVDMMIAVPLATVVAGMAIIVPLIIFVIVPAVIPIMAVAVVIMPLVIPIMAVIVVIMPLTIPVIVAVIVIIPLIIPIMSVIVAVMPLIIPIVLTVAVVIMPLTIPVIVADIIIMPLIIPIILTMIIIMPLIIPVILTGIILVLRIISVAPRIIAVFAAGVPPPVHAVIPAVSTVTVIPVIGMIPAVTVHHALYPRRLAVSGMRRPLVRDIAAGLLFLRHLPVYEHILRVFGYRADVRVVITLGDRRAQGIGRGACRRSLCPGRFLSRLAVPVSQEPPERTIFSVRDCHRAKPVIRTGLVSK